MICVDSIYLCPVVIIVSVEVNSIATRACVIPAVLPPQPIIGPGVLCNITLSYT